MLFIFQTILIRILRFLLSVYYEEVHREGPLVPEGCPTIILANHPNMLLDPVVTSVYSGRGHMSFWAKSTLFKGLPGKILRLLGAVPVHRRQDFPEGAVVDNSLLFSSSVATLEANNALVLMPEGISYSASKMQELKTGFARVAQAYHEKTGQHVPIYLCGLNYVQKQKFRGKVQISYSGPLFLNDKIEDARAQVSDLVDRVEKRFFEITVNANDFDELLDVRLARQIYVNGKDLKLEQLIGIDKRILSFYEQHRGRDDTVEMLRSEVRAYRKALERYSLGDWQINDNVTDPTALPQLFAKNALFALLALPVSAVAFLLHAPVYLIGRLINARSKYLEERAQQKLLVLFFFVPVWYAVVLGLILLFYPGWFLPSALILPIFGILQITIIQAERQSFHSLVDLMWLGLLLRNSSATIDMLRESRKRLRERITHLAQKYLAETNQESLIDLSLETREEKKK